MRCLFQLRVKLASTQIRPGQLGQGETISACGSAVSLSHRRKLTSHDFWLSLSSKQRRHPYSGAQTCTRIWVHAMISLWKKPWLICRWGWREIRNAFPIISWARFGAQNKDVGASSQTLLAGLRLRLWRRIERCLLWQRGKLFSFITSDKARVDSGGWHFYPGQVFPYKRGTSRCHHKKHSVNVFEILKSCRARVLSSFPTEGVK